MKQSENNSQLNAAKEILAHAQSVFVLTGAGISAESGVPTFRGGGGTNVWRGMPFEVLSSREMVERNLPLVWEWFDYRRGVVKDCAPNAAHRALAEWQKSKRFRGFSLATQNIDGLHAAAGSTDVIELHGSIWRTRCARCNARRELRETDAHERPPRCAKCQSLMRPDVVLFGENLPRGAFEAAHAGASACDVCLIIGTSAIVYPAAALPETARIAGARLIEINPEATPLTAICDASVRGRAGEILPQL
jgi:NAD-dependent deacetylase